ncbi:hypothetical protein IL330_03729 [Acinetobacter baumannii]|nr:hypothetical protein [Acinetobacter baumannii]
MRTICQHWKCIVCKRPGTVTIVHCRIIHAIHSHYNCRSRIINRTGQCRSCIVSRYIRESYYRCYKVNDKAVCTVKYIACTKVTCNICVAAISHGNAWCCACTIRCEHCCPGDVVRCSQASQCTAYNRDVTYIKACNCLTEREGNVGIFTCRKCKVICRDRKCWCCRINSHCTCYRS